MNHKQMIELLKRKDPETLTLLTGVACGIAEKYPDAKFFEVWEAVFHNDGVDHIRRTYVEAQP